MAVHRQVALLYAGNKGYIDEFPIETVHRFEAEFLEFMDDKQSDLMTRLMNKMELTEDIENDLKKALDEFCGQFRKSIGV